MSDAVMFLGTSARKKDLYLMMAEEIDIMQELAFIVTRDIDLQVMVRTKGVTQADYDAFLQVANQLVDNLSKIQDNRSILELLRNKRADLESLTNI